MSANHSINPDIKALEERIDDLIGVCRRLREENEGLRHSQETLIEERTKLAEKNKMARTRLESIVDRLRALEKTT
ncbi:MAG TPA: TIGR02449 family protein [Arenicellales bacterium]|nr:TIGR02449 family protein [Arenicellales bacterium]